MSTGPRTTAGKAKVRMNSTSHGVFSQHLFLNETPPEEYHALVADLQGTLRPVGGLEQALLEKIVVILWRQKRLVQAETAMLYMDQQQETHDSEGNHEAPGDDAHGNHARVTVVHV